MPQAAFPIETGGRVEGASPESMQHWCTSKIWCTYQINCVTSDFVTASDIIPFWPPHLLSVFKVSGSRINAQPRQHRCFLYTCVEILWKGLELFQDPSSPFILQKLLSTLLLAPQHPGERLALLVLGNRLIKHAHIFIIKGPCSSSKTQFRNLIACYISSSLFLSGKTTRSVEALLPCLINWRWMRQTGSGRASPPPLSFTLHCALSPCW